LVSSITKNDVEPKKKISEKSHIKEGHDLIRAELVGEELQWFSKNVERKKKSGTDGRLMKQSLRSL